MVGVVADTALISSAGLFQATGAGKARHRRLLGQSRRISRGLPSSCSWGLTVRGGGTFGGKGPG